MDASQQGQVTRSAADVYDEFFVPALFAPWAAPVADAARINAGNQVLDVACGTGVLAREAAARVRPSGSVIGLDRNSGMLAVAMRKAPEITWREGVAEAHSRRSRCWNSSNCWVRAVPSGMKYGRRTARINSS